MGFLSYLKYGFCDVFDKIRIYKWRLVLCVALSIAGFVLGIVLFNVSAYGWWYYNRCSFASKLVEAGFSVLIAFVVSSALIYFSYALCNMTRFTRYFALLLNVIVCLYCGATVSALFVYSVMWGILYAILVAVEWMAAVCLGCFVCLCMQPICRTFCEAIRDSRELLFILLVGLIYKIIALFVVIKLLTMLI